jgi:hypothetical protein
VRDWPWMRRQARGVRNRGRVSITRNGVAALPGRYLRGRRGSVTVRRMGILPR